MELFFEDQLSVSVGVSYRIAFYVGKEDYTAKLAHVELAKKLKARGELLMLRPLVFLLALVGILAKSGTIFLLGIPTNDAFITLTLRFVNRSRHSPTNRRQSTLRYNTGYQKSAPI